MTNTITIRGALGADAELRYLDSGRAVLNLSVGDNKERPDGAGNWEKVRPTIWHRVAIWGDLATMWANSGLLVRGARVEITGEQTIREYEHEGQQRWASEIRAYQVGYREPRNSQQQQGGGFGQAQGFAQGQGFGEAQGFGQPQAYPQTHGYPPQGYGAPGAPGAPNGGDWPPASQPVDPNRPPF